MAIPKMYSVSQVSEMLGVKTTTLMVWRSIGRGPKSFRVGRKVFYDEKEIAAWLRSRPRSRQRKSQAAA